jgi:CBS domain-containing protein
LLAEAFDGIPEAEVHTIMTRDVETVRPDTTFYDVVTILTRHPYRCVPVVDNGHLVGRISRGDALHAIEAMRDDPRLYGQPGAELPDDEQPGVNSAMRRARGC